MRTASLQRRSDCRPALSGHRHSPGRHGHERPHRILARGHQQPRNRQYQNLRCKTVDDAARLRRGQRTTSAHRGKTTTSVDWTAIPAWNDVNIVQPVPGSSQASCRRSSTAAAGAATTPWLSCWSSTDPAGGPRIAESFDHDPSRAPVSAGELRRRTASHPAPASISGCSARSKVSDDDAEETISSGSVSIGGASFDMRASQENGLHFQGIPIAPGL